MLYFKRRLTGGALVLLLLAAGITAPALAHGAPATADSLPDLAVTSLTLSPETPSMGELVTFSVSVKNQGEAPSGACALTGYIDEQGLDTIPVDALGAGAATEVRFTWKAKGGPHTFRAVIDSGHGVAESDEGNNDRTLAFSVLAADLTVASLTWAPVSPSLGDNVTFTVTVRNRGDKRAGSSQLDFSINGVSRGNRTLLPLEPGVSVNETYMWPALNGQHQIKAAVDVLQQVVESDETNNAREATLATPLPDLKIYSLTVAPQNIVAGDNVTITAVIKNEGTGRATPAAVTCSVDSALWDKQYTSFLSAGATATLVFEWTTDDNPHIFKVVIDANNDVAEADEINNFATAPCPLTLPDLIIQDITWTPVNPIINSPVVITITVKNQGKCRASYADLKYGIDTIYQYNALVSGLAPAETSSTSFMYFPLYYTFTVKAAIDTGNAVPESNEANNTATRTVTCLKPTPTADLALSALTVAPSKPEIGGALTLTLTVKNQGTGTAEGSFAGIYLDDKIIDSAYIDEVRAGATVRKDVTVSLRDIAYQDAYKIRVVVDADDSVPELNEFNNTSEVSFTVIAPDLVLQGISWSPEMPAVGGRVTFAVTVKNAGAVKSPAGSLSYYVDGVPAGKHLIEAVEPGASLTRQFTWTVQKQPFTLTAVVDEGAEIKDEDRSNNRKSVTLPAPDLVIDAVTWAPVMPAEIEQVTFNIVVRNQGYGASPAVLLYGYIDGAAVPFSIITGEINPGGTATVTCKYEFISGFHAIRFAADGNDALTESSETNNAKTINVTVQPLPGKTTVAAPTGPAAAPASKPAPAVSSNKTQAAATTGNVTNDLQSAPSKIQSILQNRWLIPGVAVLGVSAIGVLLVFRKRAKKK